MAPECWRKHQTGAVCQCHSLTHSLPPSQNSIKSALLLKLLLSLHTLSPWMAISFFLSGGSWAATTDSPRRGSRLHFLAALRATSSSQAFLSVTLGEKEKSLDLAAEVTGSHTSRIQSTRMQRLQLFLLFNPRPIDKRSICILSQDTGGGRRLGTMRVSGMKIHKDTRKQCRASEKKTSQRWWTRNRKAGEMRWCLRTAASFSSSAFSLLVQVNSFFSKQPPAKLCTTLFLE